MWNKSIKNTLIETNIKILIIFEFFSLKILNTKNKDKIKIKFDNS